MDLVAGYATAFPPLGVRIEIDKVFPHGYVGTEHQLGNVNDYEPFYLCAGVRGGRKSFLFSAPSELSWSVGR